MFTVDQLLDILVCVQESIERERNRMDSTTLESLKRASEKRIDELVTIKRTIRSVLGKGR